MPSWISVRTTEGQTRILAPTNARIDPHTSVVVHTDVTREVHIDQERSRFVHMVGHHLRTPLTPPLGYAHLLCDPKVDAPARDEASAAIIASVGEAGGAPFPYHATCVSSSKRQQR